MARRSDFAQKLLDDLRLRKERLATAQGSRNAHARGGDGYANTRQMIRGSTNGKGSMNMKYSPTQHRATGRQKPPEPSNQIVPFTGGRGTKQVGDFSLALAFAFEDGGKLRMTDSSRRQNPMLSFLREMGRGSMDVGEPRSVTVHVPALSQLHVKEISKGAEKLNRILRAWSNGLNFDECSVEIGKELLKGAIDLQESLRMLANLQGASLEFSTGSRQRNRIVLLEDGEDDDASNKIKRIEPPKFSFDKQSARRDRGIQQSVVAVRNMGLPALTYPKESSGFSKTNVIAKLMGLEELPANDAARSRPNSPPWPFSPVIQVERVNKSPLSQEISRMMMGSDRKVAAAKKSEKSNSARSDQKADDGRLKEQRTIDKPIRTDKNQKYEQGMMRNPDRRGSKDRKSTGTIERASRLVGKQETGPKLRGKGGNNEGKPRADDKKGNPLQDNSQRKRGDEKHSDRSAFLPKTSGNLSGPENRVTAEFVDAARTKEYEVMKNERIPLQREGARAARARERKEIPAPALRNAKVAEHLKTKKFQATKKKGGLVEGVLRPLPRSSHSHGLQKIKQEKILDGLENIKLPQTNGCISAESVSAIQEEDERRTTCGIDEKRRCQELNKVMPLPVSDRRGPVMSPLHTTVTQSQEATTLTESENRLKQVLLGSQIFIDTAETFFDLNIIPPQTVPAHEHVLMKTDDGLILDCGYEIAKRKGRLQELAVHPLVKMPAGFLRVVTLDDLIKQLSSCFEQLTLHGRNGNHLCEAQEYLPRMFEADIDARDPETNCMWDFGWNQRAFGFLERDEVVRNVEKMVIGGLIDEIARDLVQAA